MARDEGHQVGVGRIVVQAREGGTAIANVVVNNRIGAGIVVAVTAIALFGLWWFVLRSESVDVMGEGAFGVAVAGFDAVDLDGTSNPSVGDDIGRLVQTSVSAELTDADSVEIWAPNRTRRITAASDEARRQAAARRAEEIDADLLLYGSAAVDPDLGLAEVQLAFHLRSSQAQEVFPAVRLDERFGGRIEILLERSDAARPDELISLTLLAHGLQDLDSENFDGALDRFARARTALAQQDNPEAESILLGLQGYALLLRASQSGDADDPALGQAEQLLDEAVALDPGNGFAAVALDAVSYLRALGDRETIGVGTVRDPTLLAETRDRSDGRGDDTSLDAATRALADTLATQADLLLGEIDAGAARATDLIERSSPAEDPSLGPYVVAAHNNLAFALAWQGDVDGAIAQLDLGLASQHGTPSQRARLVGDRGALLGESDPCTGVEELGDAVRLARAAGLDASLVARYEAMRAELDERGDCGLVTA